MSNMFSDFLSEDQDPKVVEKVHSKVQDVLTRGEEILYIAVQKALTSFTPDSCAITTKRLILYKPKMFGKMDMEDFKWLELSDARVKEDMFTSTLSFKKVDGKSINIENLPKAQARKLYSYAQEMEENASSERRNRELEDKRAAAGGINIGMQAPQYQPQPQAAPVQVAAPDPMQKMQQLKSMLDAGMLTQEEFNTKKQEILASM